MTDSEGNALSLEEKLAPGQTVTVTVTGLTNPAEKFATKYNFNCQITYKDQFGNGYSNTSGATYGKYDFSSIPQTITVTIPEDWTESTLTLNGFMKMGGFAGDGIGSHRKVSYGDNRGMASGADAGMELGTLPEIVLNVALPHEHSYEAVVTAPTCTEGGYTTYTCSCGDSYVADETPALGHDWNGTSCRRCDVTRENPFVDVPEDSWYINYVLWAVENGVTSGVDANHFAPDMQLTRAQAVTFLWAAAGQPEPTGENSFVDVKESDWFYKAVLWAAEAGVTSGTGNGGFAPNAVCTREQVVTFLYAFKGKPSVSAEVTFPDVPGDAWYYNAVAWAAENKVTSGMGDGRFGVGVICTRAQMVTFLHAADKI